MTEPRDVPGQRGSDRPRGRFIVLEGVDGAGTTTQARRLEAWLRGRGEVVHVTREPSDGPIGTLIRQVLTGRVVAGPPSIPAPLRGESVALLFAADRLDHLQSEIEPLLARGVHVVSDRYVLSSAAYQSLDAPLEWVQAINRYAPAPDLTILLRVAPEVALARIAEARTSTDRFERIEMQRHVAATYERVAAELSPDRVLVLDGEASPDEVAAAICFRVARLVQG